MNNLLFNAINKQSYGIQFLYFLFIFFGCYLIFSSLVVVLLLLWGFDLQMVQNLQVDQLEAWQINAYKAAQIISAIGLFIMPALVFSYLKSEKGINYIKWQLPLNSRALFLTLIITLAAFPVLGYVMEWNQAMQLPEALSGLEQWMRNMEKELEQMTYAFLTMDTPIDLMINMINELDLGTKTY